MEEVGKAEMLATLSATLLVELERALTQAEARAAALEQEIPAAEANVPGTLAIDWEARWAQVAEQVTGLDAVIAALDHRGELVEQELSAEAAQTAAWLRQARHTGEALAEWAGHPVR